MNMNRMMMMALAAATVALSGVAVADVSIRPGFRISCDATFRTPPRGMTTLVSKDREYLLRYDREEGSDRGDFIFWTWLDGGWEPRVSVAASVVTGRVYRLVAGWDGRTILLGVDSKKSVQRQERRGRCEPNPSSRLVLGTPGRAEVANFRIRNAQSPLVDLSSFRTRELMPRVGSPATLRGVLANLGAADAGPCTVTAKARGGATVAPETKAEAT